MSNLNFSLDMGRVQSSVQASIRPAVEAALADMDIKSLIVERLKNPMPVDRYSMLFAYHDGRKQPTLIESLVTESISEVAKEYVRTQIAEQRADIEEAFRKMMQGSSSRLVKAFGKAVEDALKDDWGFELDVTVKHKEKRDDD